MFSRLMAKRSRGRSVKAKRCVLEVACQPLEERRLLANTIYVDVNSPGPTRDGMSWGSAYADLQRALSAAVWGDTVRVATGTYKPTTGSDRNISFQLKTNVQIYGGYAGHMAVNPDVRDVAVYPSILSGDIGTVGYANDNSYHVVAASGVEASAIVDGFTISGGNANGSVPPTSYGGGMYISSSSPTIVKCTFTGNSAGSGGGVYVDGHAPTLTNCTFTGNTATSGGGMCNSSSLPTLTNCTFTGNTARSSGAGGGMYNSYSRPTLTNCAISANTASSGGGMYNITSSSPKLTSCLFGGNTANSDGGGMYNTNSSSPTLANCTFRGNRAASGGGMYNTKSSSPTLTNCIVWGNRTTSGGGLYNGLNSSPTLTSCTLAGNTATSGGGLYNESSSSPIIVNSIVWWNAPVVGYQIYNSGLKPTITYSTIRDGGYPGNGNINTDPFFVRNPGPGIDGTWGTADDDNGDLRLQRISPCIDAGSNAAVHTATDMNGNPRIVNVPSIHDPGAIIDMGAYEFPAPSSIGGTVFNDMNADGIRGKSEGILKAQKVFLDTNNNGKLDAGEPSQVTGSTGGFNFTNLLPGAYHLHALPGTGWRVGGPIAGYDLTVGVGQAFTGKNFGLTQMALVSGTVFNDADDNKIKAATEGGLAGWTVFVDKNKNGVLDKGELSAKTNAAGAFSLSLPAASYTLRVVSKTGYKSTTPAGGKLAVKLSAGRMLTGQLFGFKK